MEIPPDLEAQLRNYIPPFGSFRNPVDITGASPPATYEETARLLMNDDRVDSVIFGYWETVITPPMVFATALARVINEAQERGIFKPVVASLSGDSGIETAARYLEKQGIPSYPYTPEKAVAALSALYKWTQFTSTLEEAG
jgi:acyl-CoA synthetase (NDP forming)